jgi:two-component system heavy metal sensor histidine kinase CusS
MKRPQSITFRLTLFFSTASTVVLIVIGYWVGVAVEMHFEEQDRHELEGKLALIRHTLSKAHSPNDLENVAQRLEDALVGHHGLSISVVGPDRRRCSRRRMRRCLLRCWRNSPASMLPNRRGP